MSEYLVAGEQLRALIERIERVEEEIKELNSDKSDIYKEAKGNGFDVKTVRKVVALRKLDSSEREEQDTLLDIYLAAIGMLPDRPSRVHVHEAAPTRH